MRTDHSLLGQFPASDQREARFGPGRSPQIMAWVVLWSAFTVFWILVVGSFVGAKHYYDTASVPRSAALSLEQGIVLFRDAVSSTLVNALDNLSLREGDALLVGQGARASVSMFDGSKVVLYSGSELRLSELRQSRFHDGFTYIGLRLEKGTARIEVGPPSTRASQFMVATPHGSALLGIGDFGLEVSETQTRISSRAGPASVLGASEAAELRAGQKAMLARGGVSGPMPEGDQLVVNGSFPQGFAGWLPLQVDEPGRPVEPSQRMLLTERIDGRETVALRLTRVSPRGTHNETGLTQILNKDVSDYRSLQLNANIRVDDQSLSGGGYMGYEYPMMIRVRYRDATGGQIDWSHGFFHKNPENRPTPNGELVPQGLWISYLGELMEVEPKPVYLISIEVLGAGHSFDGMVANVGLVGK